jgi:hypothetical protein
MSAADNVESRAAGAKKWEQLCDPTSTVLHNINARAHVPENPLQALMESQPGWEPNEDRETLQHRREIVAACIELLDARSRWVINGFFSERLSLFRIGKQLSLSKVHVMRLKDQSIRQLQYWLLHHPIIRERLNMASDWRHAAFDELLHMVGNDTPHDLNISDVRDRAVTVMHADYDEGIVRHLTRLGEWAYNTLLARSDSTAGDLTQQILDLLCVKQKNYGHGNINRFGLLGVVVRSSDKVERYLNLTANQLDGSADETVTDTLIDLVGYSVIARMLHHDTFKLQLNPEMDSDND